ncbi:alginate lyase family protein [Glycomyces sp. MUSA5-2]|uniref:alginate lyase family protein n=1 Tax=Glycomyces sp. MUSA5-2 TaxID=2053002 RepID=UPI00300BE54D
MSDIGNRPRRSTGLNRRNLIRGAMAAGGLAALGAAGAAYAQNGTHPGALHTQADFDRMKQRVFANQAPWLAGWNKLIANTHSHPTWTPNPQTGIYRGEGWSQNYQIFYNDIHAAYQNALRWRITGTTAHRDCAVNILNAWSGTLEEINGSADRWLASGIYGYQAANAAELVRDAPGFDRSRFQSMLANIFYPMCDHFLRVHNGACITNYWANWDLCNMAAIMAIGIFNDDRAKFSQAVDYFWNGAGNGSITNAIPFVHNAQYAQWQESGRDQGHSMMGIGMMATIMEMAWNQGVDLYSARDNAFAKAAEYVARYNLGYDDLPFTKYTWGTGVNCDYREHTTFGTTGRGQTRAVWEMVYGHYYNRRGRAMPNVAAIIDQVRPEGGGGDYGSTSGGYDTLGFGTLCYTR